MKTAKIFIVEDDSTFALVLQEKLLRSGFTVTGVVNNGLDAIAHTRIFLPDLILMDIDILGGMNGIQTALHIQLKQPIPIIFLSATLDHEMIKEAKAINNCTFLDKMVRFEILQEEINRRIFI